MPRTQMKLKFYECVSKKVEKQNSFKITAEKYQNLIKEVKEAKSGHKKINRHYRLLKHYDVMSVGGKEQLIYPMTTGQVLFYVSFEEIFDILYEVHEAIGHAGRDRMRSELQKHYKNITIYDVQTFLNLCESCLQKRKGEKRSIEEEQELEVVPSHFTSRGHLDVIDFQSKPNGEFKFIMIYQDHITKFVILRALKSEKEEEIAQQLLDIFLLFGAPIILQTKNLKDEFSSKIIENLNKMWPMLTIIQGKDELQDERERAKQQIEKMITIWMYENKSNNWSKGLGFVQFLKNQALDNGLKMSPFEAMFGQPASIGRKSSLLNNDLIQSIKTEEDLENICKKS